MTPPRPGRLVWAQLSGFPWWPAMVCNHPTLGRETREGRVGKEVHCMFLGQVSRAWVNRVQPWEQEVTLGEEEEVEWGDMWHQGVEEGRRTKSLSDQERLEKLLVPLEESNEEEREEEKQSREEEEEKQSLEEEEQGGMKQGLEEEETEGEKQNLEEEESLELRLSSSSDDRGSSTSEEERSEASDSRSDESQFKPAKFNIKKQEKKSEYEKLRDINIAEREKALNKSGLLKEISEYKKEYLGKVMKTRLPEDSNRSAVGGRVKMSQCRHCQEKVPVGMMVLHKRYFHSKTKEKIYVAPQQKTVNMDLKEECPRCHMILARKMMNLHMTHYHALVEDTVPLRLGLSSQEQGHTRHQKLQIMKPWEDNEMMIGKSSHSLSGEHSNLAASSQELVGRYRKRKHEIGPLFKKRLFLPLVQLPGNQMLPQDKKFFRDQELPEDRELPQFELFHQDKEIHHTDQELQLGQKLDQDLDHNVELHHPIKERCNSTSTVSLPPDPSSSSTIAALVSPTTTPSPPANEVAVSCPMCPAVVSSQEELHMHVEDFHCETKVSQSYSCPHCPASFQGLNNLLTHVREAACRTKREQGKDEGTQVVVEYIDLLSEEEADSRFEVCDRAGKRIIKVEAPIMVPPTPTIKTFPKAPSQAQRTAEELARRGLNVSVVSPEQELLQEVVMSLGAVERGLAVLVGRARVIQPGGAEGLRRVLGKALGPGLKEVEAGLEEVQAGLGHI